ncbi:FecR family protein [Chitinophaga sp. LS1]|uniref:FecR family protein n=1 Tax=Chitinophaga sp. LS1 TaxID=3051176 RepID=UPI002AAC48BF|nr:FecR domain-containing protein [Chitinophaga sp. LS1]WPV64117.1 FecR domain-containing protein [Chitinophaga sp. LS1]
MIHNEEHIFQLILEKLSGEISQENLDYLNKVAGEDPSVQRCLDEMEDALNAAGPGFMTDVYNEMAWGKVLSLLDADQMDGQQQGRHKEEGHFQEEHLHGEHVQEEHVQEELKAGAPSSSEIPAPAVIPEEPVEQVRIVKKSPSKIWLAAASLLVLVPVGLFFLLSAQKNGSPASFASNSLNEGMIKLLLENGDTIGLPENNSADIAAQQVKLHPVPGQLTFTPTGNANGWNTLLVPTGRDYRVVLADGSQVHLNAFSRLRFPFAFNGSTREVYLEGEAYFNIAPDPLHPFIVHTGTITTKVLGTAFNVNAYTDSMVVTSLVQGSVSTTRSQEAVVLLKPGMETVYASGHSQIVRAFDENITLGWRKGEYTYYNQPLSSIDAVIRHWYGKTLVFEDTTLTTKMLTGVIERDHPITEFLDGLKKTSGIAYQITAEKIYLSSNN